ncbi:hypothetical protein ACFVHR_15285 [Streptomyces sp. NPDC127168]|uniref:hypothetical protein n=1 Tax=unclassified Streptomyces TaxID=2593676 RepID=UPI00362F6F17
MRMNEFYDSLTEQERASAENVARKYGRKLDTCHERLLTKKVNKNAPYYVGLSSDLHSFTHITKRVPLVMDTLMLSEHGVGAVHELGMRSRVHHGAMGGAPGQEAMQFSASSDSRYGLVTEDLAKLGRWMLASEPLLRMGLVWYEPAFVEGRAGGGSSLNRDITPAGPLPSFQDRSIDYLVTHRRAVDLSRNKPLANHMVRPILEIDLPFIDGLTLRDFAQVTSEEFDSYRQCRDFLRSRLLELDDALEAVDSQVALERIALSIRDEMNAATTEMSNAARSQALSRCGAVLGTTSALLAAVRPEALQGALATSATLAAGATGLWPTIQAFADSRTKRTQGKWHYVWVLQKKAAQ